MTDIPKFAVRVRYWPSLTGLYWWDDFNSDTLRREFDAAQVAGLRSLEIDLVWKHFQPESHRINPGAMRELETVLELALAADIEVSLAIFAGMPRSVNPLPDWILEPFPSMPAPATARSVYRDPDIVAGEERLVGEIVGEFCQHPALATLILVDRFTMYMEPKSESEFEEWVVRLSEATRRSGSRQPLLVGITASQALRSSLDLRSLAGNDLLLRVADGWRPSWSSATSADWLGFLAAYCGAMAGTSVEIGNIGPCTRSSTTVQDGCLDEPDALRVAESLIRAVRDNGACGVQAPALFDYAPSLRAREPFRSAPTGMTRGLLRRDGSPKSMAAAYSEASFSSVEPVTLDFTGLDWERRSREPELLAREAYMRIVS